MDFEMKIQPALISHLLIFVSEKKCKKMCRRDQTSRSLSVESNTSLQSSSPGSSGCSGLNILVQQILALLGRCSSSLFFLKKISLN